MHKVSINKLKLYGYHGCLEEEEIAGGRFLIDAELYLDLNEAAETDDLSKTVDYELAIETIRNTFSTRSKLIEQVGGRVIKALKKEFPMVEKVVLTIHKPSAPISAEFGSVSITIEG